VSNTIGRDSVAGQHDNRSSTSRPVDIEAEHEALIRSHNVADGRPQADTSQNRWNVRQKPQKDAPAGVETTGVDSEEKPSVRRKWSSQTLIWVLAAVTGASLLTGVAVKLNTDSAVAVRDEAIAAAHQARDEANDKADVANTQTDEANASAIAIEDQLASVGASIQIGASEAAAKIEADKAAAAAAKAAVEAAFADDLENALVHNSTVTGPQGQSVSISEANCTALNIDAEGVGTYTCQVTFSDGDTTTDIITVDADGGFSNH
jgi:hypothetical protein